MSIVFYTVVFFILSTGNVFANFRDRQNSSSERSLFYSGAPAVLDLGAGMVMASRLPMPGVNIQIAARLNTSVRLYAGGELGLFIYPMFGASNVFIPILGTVFSEVDISDKVHPTMGISTGPTLSLGGEYSYAQFAFLLNPGVRISLKQNMDLNLLARFGMIGSQFVVIPQLGASFEI
jgi:hypothetical protein